MTVLVAGATGTTGSEIVRGLRAAGVAVRAMTRSEGSAGRLRGEGVEALVADLADPGSLPAALAGIDAVYVATDASPELAERQGGLARAAAAAGVAHVVKLSVIGASPGAPIGFGRLHAAAEAAIRDSGVGWTMVRPNGFMQNTLAWAPQLAAGVVRGPVMDARWSIVDVRDVAAVAVAALRHPEAHAGRAYTVTGPEPSSPREQVAVLAELLGRPLAVEHVPVERALAGMRAAGWPAWSAERMGELFGLYAQGGAEAVSPDVEMVTGTAPRSYREFAADHLAAFAPG